MSSRVAGQGERAALLNTEPGEAYGDPYSSELGPGEPVYNAWAIEDDHYSHTFAATPSAEGDVEEGDEVISAANKEGSVGAHSGGPGKGPQHRYHGRAQRQCFRTPGGQPSSHELWRFQLRGCQDCWAALFFIVLVVGVIVWGITQMWELSLTEQDIAVIAGDGAGQGYAALSPTTTPVATRGRRQAASGEVVDHSDVLRNLEALRAGVAALQQRMAYAHGASANGTAHPPSPSSDALNGVSAGGLALRWVVAATVTIVTAYGGLLLLAAYPRQLIFIQSTVASMMFATLAGLSLLTGSLLMALLFAFMTFLPLLWIYLIQDRIPFTATMLCATVSVLRRHRSLFLVSVVAAFVSWYFVTVSVLYVLPSVLRLAAGVATGQDIVYPIVLIFCVFWVLEVLSTVVHVTTCGLMATWYFAGEAYMPSDPVKRSLKRAVTTSFGSVCLGSLVTAIVSFIHFLVECARSNGDANGFWMCLVDCLVGCIEDLVRYFNQYAFVHVAVYGCSYVDGAKETWALVKQCAFSAIFNDALTSQAIGILSLMCALLVAVVTLAVTWSGAAAGMMFVMSLLVCNVFYRPVSSCVSTILVCFAEVPVGLQLSFPELYDELVDADGGYTQRRGEASAYGTASV